MNARRPDTTALKPIGLPRPVEVQTDIDGLPVAVAPAPAARRPTPGRPPGRPTERPPDRSALVPVESIEEAWRVGEEWWREAPLERTYYLLLLEGGRPITVFHDGVFDAWFEQRY
ncbi:MAG: hypothetical protein AB7F65_06420 [Dehalococcoidia bacterium]